MEFYRPPSIQATIAALGSMNRAVRAWKFYPKGHPTRLSSLNRAYTALRELLDGNTLQLSSGRTGFSFPNDERIKDSTCQSTTLAYELFVRRVLKITFCHDLLQEDFREFLKILCLSPEVIRQSGGIDSVMAARGIRSIWVNEFDLAVIRSKIEKLEAAGIPPQWLDEDENGDEASTTAEQFTYQSETSDPDQELQMLLGRLLTCIDDDIYLILVRQAVICAENLALLQKYSCIFPLIEILASASSDEGYSERMKECSQFALEQIGSTGDIGKCAIEQTGLAQELSYKALLPLLKAGGDAAITHAAELLGRTDSRAVRKTVSTLLVNVGDAAVPPLLKFMNDPRWFIIRNLCTILGDIGSQDAREALTDCLHHPDLRVRKETVRALAKLGGDEAEETILAILRDTDAALYSQAIASLGWMKSTKALSELIIFVFSRDLFLKSLPLKIDALAAIAAIGDSQVTPYLASLLEERFLLAPTRGRQLKTAVAVCLGKLGDDRAVPFLEAHASSSGELGSACSTALSLIEKQRKQ